MAKTYAAVLVGVEIEVIEVEAVVGSGFSGLVILGLSGDTVRDMRERVRSVLDVAGIALPARKIVVSFSPLQKLRLCRTQFEELDFAVAACVVRAIDEDKQSHTEGCESAKREFFFGSLTLAGSLRSISKPLLVKAIEHKELLAQSGAVFRIAAEADCLESESHAYFKNFEEWLEKRNSVAQICSSRIFHSHFEQFSKQFSQESRLQRLQAFLKTFEQSPHLLCALLVAGARNHNILLVGEPGVGKSFAIKQLENVLAPLSQEEYFQTQLIADENGENSQNSGLKKPFRAPHHSCTSAALIGGANLKPGEVTLAHHGVLFLDELAEFSRTSLEALREPLDSGKVAVSRAAGSVNFPAKFFLCATTNPCPCGFLFSRKKGCRCSHGEMSRYMSRLSGPLLDRFALQVVLEPDAPAQDAFAKEMSRIFLCGEERALAERFVHTQDFFSGGGFGFAESLISLGEKPEAVSRRTDGHLENLARTFSFLFPNAHANWGDILNYRVMEARFSKIRS